MYLFSFHNKNELVVKELEGQNDLGVLVPLEVSYDYQAFLLKKDSKRFVAKDVEICEACYSKALIENKQISLC